MRKIILASESPRRKQLLQQVGLKFQIDPSGYEEDMNHSKDPYELAEFLSLKKAQNVANKYKDEIIIAGDSLISCNGEIFGKPHTPERAREMLKALSGITHEVISGYALIDTRTNKIISGAKGTKVYFRKLEENEIMSYIKTGEPLDRAGAYAIQEKGAFLIDKIEGDYTNVIGLPITEIIQSLRKLGLKVMQ